MDAEVIVVGAGAAGLSAASRLVTAGREVLVLEARDRIGGRCWTRRMPGLPAPIELGAEFIHGPQPATLALLEGAGLPGVDSTRTQRTLFRGRLRDTNAFAEAKNAVRRTAALKRRDLPFAEFLRRQRLTPLQRTLALMMVRGFDAADPARVSAREIAEEWDSGALGASQMRPQGGYQPLLEILSRNLRVRMNSAVREVRWQRGAVELLAGNRRFKARRAIVTLPLGVLQSGAVVFSPGLRKERALEKLASGPVIRVAMRFREPFWEKRFPGVAFFHSPQAPFPTFWTPLPMHAPLLTAWAGGPKAAAMTGSGRKKLLAEALTSLRSVFGRIPGVLSAFVQDWQADPYSRGGYSYVTVGGQGARGRLAKPLEGTLFFAGEATDSDESGTVAGALKSGARAAGEVLRAR